VHGSPFSRRLNHEEITVPLTFIIMNVDILKINVIMLSLWQMRKKTKDQGLVIHHDDTQNCKRAYSCKSKKKKRVN